MRPDAPVPVAIPGLKPAARTALPTEPRAARRGVARACSDRMAFLRGFVRDPAGVGAILPSSRRLERHIIARAQLSHARTVVELGPGTGGTTRALLQAMGPHTRLLAIERDALFHARLLTQLADPRLTAVHGNAEHLGAWLTAMQLPAPDVIVSGLPFSTLPPGVGARLARAIVQALPPGGRLVAYQLRAEVRSLIQPWLGEPQQAWTWCNLPPMRVMSWTRPH